MKEMLKKYRLPIIIVAAVLAAVLAVGVVFLVNKQNRIEQRNKAVETLLAHKGEYDEQSIVLCDTDAAAAKALAEKTGAKLRISNNGKFAALTLPENTSIIDVYSDDAFLSDVSKMSADWHVSAFELLDYDDDEAYSVPGMPEIPEDIYDPASRKTHIPTRPVYNGSDEGFNRQSYLDYMNMQDIWANSTGSGVTVAIIDTGIDTDHPEFAGKISEYSYNASQDKIVKDYLLDKNDPSSYDWSLIEDERGHGTSVAGVIAAAMDGNGTVGIAPDVTLVIIKAENENGTFKRSSDLVFGLYYAIERDVDIVNMSFGHYFSEIGDDSFVEPLQLAVDSDILCFASAGNDSTSMSMIPASDENCIGVGALEDGGWGLAEYSNYGPNSDIVAPGTTYTAKMGGGYWTQSGTSLSSPAAAGAAALYKAIHGYTEYKDYFELLKASCYDLGDLGEDYIYGFGAVDVNALIREERGKLTYDYLTDEIDNTTQLFIRDHTIQYVAVPERPYAVFDGWFYDPQCTDEYNYFYDEFSSDLTLYARWINEDDGIPYTYVVLPDNTVEIRSYTGHRRYITIPDYIDGRIVSSIGGGAFANQTRLREVNLPRYLQVIGGLAFSGCSNLIKMSIPETVVAIGSMAFASDSRLWDIRFEGNSQLLSVGEYAFSGTAIYEIELPAKLESIDGTAFDGCLNLLEINLKPANVHFTAPDGVLYNYSQTEIVAYPAGRPGEYELLKSVRVIGVSAFCSAKISRLNIENVEVIGDGAFSGSRIRGIDMPDSVYYLGANAFYFCSHLSDLRLSGGLTQINVATFMGCSSLKPFTMPASIMTIGQSAFRIAGMEEIYFEEGSKLVSIEYRAFCGSGIQRLSLPASLVSIGDLAFSESAISDLRFVKDGELISIGEKAFAYTSDMKTLEFPDKLQKTGEYAFLESGVTGAVVIPKALTDLGIGTFAACHRLTDIHVEAGHELYMDVDGVVFTTDEKTLVIYPAGNARNEYTVKENTETVFDSAFYGSYELDHVYLPETLVYIQRYGFFRCKNLQSMLIPDSVYQISHYAFAETTNLKSIIITENCNLPRISFAAFAYSGIESFTVPSKVHSIAQKAFEGCLNLHTVIFNQNSRLENITAYMFNGADNLQEIIFMPGAAVTSIQAHGFEGMRNLRRIDFGDAVITNIDNYAFRFCTGLTEFNVPEGVTFLGRYAFYQCANLSTVTLPESLQFIGRYAFLGTKESNIYFSSEVLPAVLQEDWDHGIASYHLGASEILENGYYKYAKLKSGNISIIKYSGNEKTVDLNAVGEQLGGNITVIGGKAFFFSSIENLTLPDTLVTIQANAFYHSPIRSLSVPDSVTFIGKSAFAATSVESLTFGKNSRISIIEQSAFEYTEKLSRVTVPGSLTQLGRNVFKNSGIEELHFGDGFSLTEIPKEAFAYTKLRTVTIPECVTVIGDGAFRNTDQLETLNLPTASELMIRSNAFYRSGLRELYIPENVTYIGEYAFIALHNLSGFNVSENNEFYKSENGLLLSKDGRKLISAPAGLKGDFTVPLSVECLGFGAFEESSLSSVNFDKDANILTFGFRAFYSMKNLTQIKIPASVISIDFYAFAECTSLHTVLFEEGNRLTGIYEGAFCNCVDLQNIDLPDTVAEISDFSFYGCGRIEKIPLKNLDNLKGIYDYSFAYTGIKGEIVMPKNLYDIGPHALEGTAITKVTIPDDEYKSLMIGLGAFENCNYLEELDMPFIGERYNDRAGAFWIGYIFGAGSANVNSAYIPESLHKVTAKYAPEVGLEDIFAGVTDRFTEISIGKGPKSVISYISRISNAVVDIYEDPFIDYYALDYPEGDDLGPASLWPKLEKIDLPSTLIEVGRFQDSEKLESIVIPEGARYITANAFCGCKNLKNVVLPEGLLKICNDAFAGCISLKSIEIPDGITKICNGTFSGCTALEEITLPDSIKQIKMHAFFDCKSLCSIDIPSSVTDIGANAFMYCESLRSVDIPDGIEILNDNVFCCCSSLKNVSLPDSLKSIGYHTFFACFDLRSIVIPQGVTEIGFGAFDNCSTLSELYMPPTVTVIHNEAFKNCGFRTIVIPECVETIGKEAFQGNNSLTELTLPESLLSVGQSAFECERLYTIYNNSDLDLQFGSEDNGRVAFNAHTIYDKYGNKHTREPDASVIMTPDGFIFENIEGEFRLTFYDGKEKTVTLPDDLNGHEYRLFDFKGPENIIIPSSMKKLEGRSFAWTDTLKSIYISEGVEEIWFQLFKNWPDTVTVTIDENNPYFKEQDGLLYSKDMTKLYMILPQFNGHAVLPDTVTELNGAFSDTSKIISVKLPNGLTALVDREFAHCDKLTEVIIPDSVTTIGAAAFCDCLSLTHIEVPPYITYLPAQVFVNCEKLQSVNMPDTVEAFYDEAFAGCKSLRSITLPESLTEISKGVFNGCTSLSVNTGKNTVFSTDGSIIYKDGDKTNIVAVLDDTKVKVVVPDGVKTITANMFANAKYIEEIVLPDGLECIENNAFSGCDSLKKINIPQTVTRIGQEAFCECGSLQKITLPPSLSEIEGGLFFDCSSLKRIVVPEGVTRIGGNAFYMCSALEEIVLPSSLEFIDSGVFGCTNNVKKVYYQGTVEQWCDIYFTGDYSTPLNNDYEESAVLYINGEPLREAVIPEGVREIKDYTFYKCVTLQSVTLPSTLTSIGEHSFVGSGIKSITIPDGIESVNLSYCAELECAVLPDSVRDICFGGCSSLTRVNIPDSVTRLSSGCFLDCISLKSIIIPDNITEVEDAVFASCCRLENVTFGAGMHAVPSGMFAFCGSLRTVDIPDSITRIESRAFRYSGIVEVHLPSTLEYIDPSAFEEATVLCVYNNSELDITLNSDDCGHIAERSYAVINKDGTVQTDNRVISEEEGYDYICTDDGFVFDVKDGKYRLRQYVGMQSTVTLPADINGHEYTIYRFFGAINVIVPEGVVELPEFAFSGAYCWDGGEFRDMLYSITLPNSLRKIGDHAFDDLQHLSEIDIPEGVTELGLHSFAWNMSLRTVHLPQSLEKIGEGSFKQCSSLESVNLHDNITEIGFDAFWYCTSLEEIHIPAHLKVIEGNSFAGLEKLKSVVLPDGLESLGGFSSCTSLQSVNIPDSVTVIENGAFSRCTSLTSIVIPDKVTAIKDAAFYGCTSLSDIQIGDNITFIGGDVFTDTAFFNDPDNWHDDALYLKDHLIRISPDVVHVKQVFDKKAATDAINHSPKIKSVTISGYSDAVALQNLETLTVTNVDYFYFCAYPFTLKNLVIGAGVNIPEIMTYDSSYTIYVERDEKDVRWDENFPDWNKGIKVYYADKWVRVCFYDINGRMISNDIYTNSHIIRAPYYKPEGDKYTDYSVLWDMNGDGEADRIPAMSSIDLHLTPVITPVDRTYGIMFTRDDGTVISYQKLAYADTITAPEAREKQGYVFSGYEGYTEGMTVSGDAVFTESWVHIGGGHQYTHTHIEASCAHEGYDEYVCPVCGDSYRENTVPLSEHSFGDWSVDSPPSCAGHGTEKRVCSVCGYGETGMLPPTGHDYVSKVKLPAACTHEGLTEYKCRVCGEQYSEKTEKLPHNYKKHYKLYTLVEIIIRQLKCFFGIENDYCYFYVCENCGKYMMPEEYSSGARSQSVSCRHTETETVIKSFDNCETENMEIHICKKCGEVTEVYSLEAIGHDLIHHDAKAPTCTETGWNAYDTCSRCDYTTYSETAALGHEYKAVVSPPKCTEKGFTTYTCSHCEDSYITDYTDAAGHKYGEPEWIWTGYEAEAKFTCSVCDDAAVINAAVVNAEDKGIITYTATAVFNEKPYTNEKTEYVEYTIKFVDYDGKTISEKSYHYGDNVTVPNDPAREEDDKYTYVFKGWDKGVTTVTADATYTAAYDRTEKPLFIPGDINGDGEANNKDVVALFRFVSGSKADVNEIALDVNGDGEVNNKDVVELFRFVSKAQ